METELPIQAGLFIWETGASYINHIDSLNCYIPVNVNRPCLLPRLLLGALPCTPQCFVGQPTGTAGGVGTLFGKTINRYTKRTVGYARN